MPAARATSARRAKTLSAEQQADNSVRYKTRSRVEYVFAFQRNNIGGKLVRTIGLARAEAKIGLVK